MLKKSLNQSLVFWVAGLVLVIDQFSKYLVRARLPIGGVWSPTPAWEPYFRLLHIENNGAAFGMFQSGGLVFTVVAVVVSAVIIYYALRLPDGQWALRFVLGLQLGGALGNLIDRLISGPVTDFFSLLSAFNTPIFNVADLSITVGVILLVLMMLGESRGAAAPAETPETPSAPPTEPADAGPQS